MEGEEEGRRRKGKEEGEVEERERWRRKGKEEGEVEERERWRRKGKEEGEVEEKERWRRGRGGEKERWRRGREVEGMEERNRCSCYVHILARRKNVPMKCVGNTLTYNYVDPCTRTFYGTLSFNQQFLSLSLG